MQTESRELLAVGIFGNKSRIGDRIEMLLQRNRRFSLRASRTCVVASAIVLGGLMLAGSLAPRPKVDMLRQLDNGLSASLKDLGLKLEPRKIPIEMLVIDHIEKPSEN